MKAGDWRPKVDLRVEDAEDMRQVLVEDHYQCEIQAESVTGPVPLNQGLLGIWANRARVEELVDKCMRARGYQPR